jgi:hypothetical protein
MRAFRQFSGAAACTIRRNAHRWVAAMTPERMLALGFEDVIDGTPLPADCDAVAITVGRVDWVAWPWAGHPEAWSPWVVETGRDFVGEAIAAAGARRVTLIVDVMVEGWIARDSSIAGVDARGERSTEFASITSLDGVVGDRIVELVAEVARRGYGVTLTEGFLDRWTFGADDLDAYRAHSGTGEWPLTPAGDIDEGHPSIGAWRCAAMTRLVARCAAVSPAGLRVEVRAQWDGPLFHDGQDYRALLEVSDGLVVWGYFALAGREPEALAALELPPGSTLSIGLWEVSPDALRRALAAASHAPTVAVVPLSLVTPEHAAVLRQAWG